MKKLLLFIGLFAITVGITKAQDGINYQAVVRDDAGELMKNEAVAVEFSIVETSTAGVKVYTETHALTTNNFGNIVALIGQGTPTLGTFNTIDWGDDKHFLNVVIDGTDMGTTEFLSVPYALHAKTADALTDPNWNKTGIVVYNEENKVVIGSENSSANKLTVTELDYTSGELVDFTVDSLSSNADLLNLHAEKVGSVAPGQFIEMSLGSTKVFALNTDGGLTKPATTGSANMLPIAYGIVTSAGALSTGTDNIGTITRTSTGVFEIEIVGESMNMVDYIVSVNSVNSSSSNVSWGAFGPELTVFVKDIATDTYTNEGFNFVIYKP